MNTAKQNRNESFKKLNKAERLKDKEQKPTPTTQPVSQPTKEIRLNYLGLPMTGENNNTTTRNHITSKIFNW